MRKVILTTIGAQRLSTRGLSVCRLLIGGEWQSGANEVDVLDKFHNRPVMVAQLPSAKQVADCVRSANAAFKASQLAPYDRGAILDRAADRLEMRTEELVEVLRREAGFPRRDALGEIQRCAATCRLSAEEARRLTGGMVPLEGSAGQGGRLGFTLRVPLGVVCAITPFNAPLNTVAHKVCPALAAGNAVILKPSLHTPMTSCILAECLLEAGLPSDLLSVVHGDAEVAQWLLNDDGVHFFAFTGSTQVGRAIQQRAGLRRTQMELGSIAHCILCNDADLNAALPKVINASYRKAGQVCTSIQVLLVDRALVDKVEHRLTELVSGLPFGDPANDSTVVGPLISENAAIRVESWIAQAVQSGARLLVGGGRSGSVVCPTLLANVSKTTPLGCQEIFGPVLTIAPFNTLDEAINRVNATPYGLAAGIFTQHIANALDAARKLQVGGVHINETPSSRVDLMPYGGSKDSGFGREGPYYAIREMSEERMVTILA
jgi:acyl-CoA reductase-like NAD-dependent aldehyde dehydrogenase